MNRSGKGGFIFERSGNSSFGTLRRRCIAYPKLRKLLTIFATLPVTTPSSERSFSTMRRLKTHLRSTMGDQRLTSLALLSVHRDRPVDKDSVLNEYAISSNRRSDFLL